MSYRSREPNEVYIVLEELWEVDFEELGSAIKILQEKYEKHSQPPYTRIELWPPQEDEHGELTGSSYELIGVRLKTEAELQAEKDQETQDEEFKRYKELASKFGGKKPTRTRL